MSARSPRVACVAGWALVAALLPGVASAAPPPAARAIHYRFTVDAGLTRLTGRVCFDGTPPTHLYPGTSRYLRFLAGARRLPQGPKLPVGRDGIELAGVPAGACIRYRVDLAAAVAHPPTHQVLRVGTDPSPPRTSGSGTRTRRPRASPSPPASASPRASAWRCLGPGNAAATGCPGPRSPGASMPPSATSAPGR